jgi:hypothetical protein
MWTRCWTRDGMSTIRWRPTRRQMRVLLRLQDQCAFKLKPRLIVRNEGKTYEGLNKQLGGAQVCGQGVGQETG